MSDPTGWRPFTPTAQAVRIMATTDPTQNKRLAVFLDQHRNAAAGYPDGRAWWGFVERAANGADMPGLVGELMPVAADAEIRGRLYKGWIAPWLPDAKYINRTIGLMDGNHFEIDYTGMEIDWKQEEDAYYQRAITAALAHDLPVPNIGAAIDYRVKAIVGPQPRSPRIPQAAKTGHQWLLGFSTEKDELLERLLAASGSFEMPTADQLRAREGENDRLRREVFEMKTQMQEFFAKQGQDALVPTPGKPKKAAKSGKREATPAQLAALAKGRQKKSADGTVGGLEFSPGGAR